MGQLASGDTASRWLCQSMNLDINLAVRVDCQTHTLEELVIRRLLHIRPETHLHPSDSESRLFKHLLQMLRCEIGAHIEHEHPKVGQTTQNTVPSAPGSNLHNHRTYLFRISASPFQVSCIY